MSDPYIPSGREYDEGDIPSSRGADRGRIRRGIDRLKSRRKAEESRVRRLETAVANEVGERLPGPPPGYVPIAHGAGQPPGTADSDPRPTLSATNQDVGTKAKRAEPKAAKAEPRAAKAEPKAVKKADPKAAKAEPKTVKGPSSATSNRADSGAGEGLANIIGRSTALGLDATALLVVLSAEGDLKNPKVRSVLDEALEWPTAPPLGAALVDWLLQVSQQGSTVTLRTDDLESVSPDAIAVLEYVAMLSGNRLATYRSRSAIAAEWEEAMRDLDKAAARYGSLAGLALELRAGRLHPNWVQNIGGFTAASYKYCSEQISAAIAAHQKHTGKSKPPRWPSNWGGPPSGIGHDMLCAVAVRLSDSPVARRRLRSLRARLVETSSGSAAQAELLTELGIQTMSTEEPKGGPTRRRAKRRQE